jgi:hypothetical protein
MLTSLIMKFSIGVALALYVAQLADAGIIDSLVHGKKVCSVEKCCRFVEMKCKLRSVTSTTVHFT